MFISDENQRLESQILTTDMEDFEQDSASKEDIIIAQMNNKINSLTAQIEHLKQQLNQKSSKEHKPNREAADLESHQ
jgi:uncharacterized small protein (DUF1192 family)